MQRTEAKWYIIRTAFNKEKKLVERIENEIDRELKNVVVDVLLPMKNETFMKNKKKVERESLLIPGYVYVKTNAPAELKTFLIQSQMGNFLVDNSRNPQIISEREISKLRYIEEDQIQKAENSYILGEKVKINDGPFETLVGEISEVDKAGDKIKVIINIFGRLTTVDLSVNQVNKY